MFILKEAVDLCELLLKYIELQGMYNCIVKVESEEKQEKNNSSLYFIDILQIINTKQEEVYTFNGLKVTWDVYLMNLLEYMLSKKLLKNLILKGEGDNLDTVIILNILNIVELKKAINSGDVKVL